MIRGRNVGGGVGFMAAIEGVGFMAAIEGVGFMAAMLVKVLDSWQ